MYYSDEWRLAINELRNEPMIDHIMYTVPGIMLISKPIINEYLHFKDHITIHTII